MDTGVPHTLEEDPVGEDDADEDEDCDAREGSDFEKSNEDRSFVVEPQMLG